MKTKLSLDIFKNKTKKLGMFFIPLTVLWFICSFNYLSNQSLFAFYQESEYSPFPANLKTYFDASQSTLNLNLIAHNQYIFNICQTQKFTDSDDNSADINKKTQTCTNAFLNKSSEPVVFSKNDLLTILQEDQLLNFITLKILNHELSNIETYNQLISIFATFIAITASSLLAQKAIHLAPHAIKQVALLVHYNYQPIVRIISYAAFSLISSAIVAASGYYIYNGYKKLYSEDSPQKPQSIAFHDLDEDQIHSATAEYFEYFSENFSYFPSIAYNANDQGIFDNFHEIKSVNSFVHDIGTYLKHATKGLDKNSQIAKYCTFALQQTNKFIKLCKNL